MNHPLFTLHQSEDPGFLALQCAHPAADTDVPVHNRFLPYFFLTWWKDSNIVRTNRSVLNINSRLKIEKLMNSREKILANASELIHTKGYNHTSIHDILQAASVTKSNFYYHFESKEQLMFEILAQRMREFYALVIEPSLHAKNLNPLQRLHALLDRLQELGKSSIGELGCPFGNLAQEMSPIHEALRRPLSAMFNALSEALEQCLEEGKDAGLLQQSVPSRQLADFALAQIQGAFLLRKTHKDPEIFERNMEMLRQVVQQWL